MITKKTSNQPVSSDDEISPGLRPEQQRFIDYGRLYAENQPPPPPPITDGTVDGDSNLPRGQMTPGGKAIKTMATRRATHGPSGHSPQAMNQKKNQTNE